MEKSRSIKKKTLREFTPQKRVKLKHILGQIRAPTLLAIGSSFCHFVWFSVYTGSQQLKNVFSVIKKGRDHGNEVPP